MAFLKYFLLLNTRGMLLVVLAVAWLAGIVIADVLPIPPDLCLLLSGLLFLLLIIFWHSQHERLLLLVLLCVILGAWRYVKTQDDTQSVKRFIGTSLGIRGTVRDEPTMQAHTRLLIISVDAVQSSKNAQWQQANGTIEIITLFNGSSVEDPYGANYGDTVKLYGKLQPHPTYPKNVIASMSFPRLFVSATGDNSTVAFINHQRNQLATLIAQALPQPEAAILIAIFLGLRTPALQPLAVAFSVTGTIHMIVPSGFKVTLLSGLVSRLTQPLLSEHTKPSALTPQHKSWRDWIRAILLLLSIAFYTILSGAGPAAIRSGVMGGLLVIAPRLGRKYNVYTSLAIAAILMSCIDPFVLWDVGFQLSFLGTLGIVILTPYIQKLLQPVARIPGGPLIMELIAVTLAAQVATWPIAASTFHNISFIATIANALTVPLLGPLIFLGLAISVTGLILHPLSLLCGWITWPLLWYMQTVIIRCSTLPGAFIPIDQFDSFIGWLYYILLIPPISLLLYRHSPASTSKIQHPSLPTRLNRKPLYIGGGILLIVMTGITIVWPQSTTNTTISFFSINAKQAHGEAIFIHTQDGKTLLVDGGNDIASLSQLLDNKLPPWRRSLDMVILTSPQQDTITGLQDVLIRYDVGSVFDAGMAHPTTTYVRWRRIINERHLPYIPVAQGTTIPLGTTTQLQVLWPQDKLHSGSDEIHDNSLILRLIMPGIRVLLLGSSINSNYALSSLLTSVDANMLKADIVQVLGNTDTLVPAALTTVLAEAQPSLIVITTPTQHKLTHNPLNTHPTLSSTLTTIPQIHQTTEQGTLEIQSNINGWVPSG